MISEVFHLRDLVSVVRGVAIQTKKTAFTEVTTDTRLQNTGKLFFALKGENFDAHKFLHDAVKSGADALVIQEIPPDFSLESHPVTIVKVADTLRALQDFANFWRHHMIAKVLAVTGSNGKTTTKEFAATILSEKFKTFYSHGSFNNHFGVPMSLLSLREGHQIAIQEMGMNHPGEISELVRIADPDVVCVTTVGRAHLEFMGSLETIASAKEEIYQNSRDSAIRVYNLDNIYTKAMRARAPSASRTIGFSSFDPKADVHLKEQVSTLDFMQLSGTIAGEPGEAKVEVFGRQNVTNLMAAASMALAAGVEPDRIWSGLKKCKTTWGRNQIVKTDAGAKVIFDAYNANPDSMNALIENVSRLSVSGRKYAVIGEMLEMGTHSAEVHEEIAYKLGQGEFELIWYVGSQGESFSKGLKRSDFSKKLIITNAYDEKVAGEVGSMLQNGDIILVKGSRGMKLEKVLLQWSPRNFTQKT